MSLRKLEQKSENKVFFEILGSPKAKQSARFAKIGNYMKSYQPKEIVQHTENMRYEIISQLPQGFIPIQKGTPIIIEYLYFIFSPLSSFPKKIIEEINNDVLYYKETKPDTDNLEKMLWDAMQGIVFIEDANIVHKKEVYKAYGNRPGIYVELSW